MSGMPVWFRLVESNGLGSCSFLASILWWIVSLLCIFISCLSIKLFWEDREKVRVTTNNWANFFIRLMFLSIAIITVFISYVIFVIKGGLYL